MYDSVFTDGRARADWSHDGWAGEGQISRIIMLRGGMLLFITIRSNMKGTVIGQIHVI